MRIFIVGLAFFVFLPTASSQVHLLENLEGVRIKAGKERFDAYKGVVSLNEDFRDTTSRKITIPVLVAKSISDNPQEPVFWLAGGPGQSNMGFRPSRYLLENHDVVLVGYRGVDGDTELKSRKIAKASKGRNNRLLSNESIDRFGEAIAGYLDVLAASGIDPGNYTMVNVIEDVEAVRKQLGYEQINLLSASYGTRVAQIYSHRYPEVINRTVMVGANPPMRFIWEPEKTSEVIALYDSLYMAGDGRNLGVSIADNIEVAMKNMPKRWFIHRLDADKIKAATFLLLYNKENAVIAFNAYYRAATKGDYSGLYLMQLLYDFILPRSFTWGDLFLKAATADLDSSRDYRKLFPDKAHEIGSPLSVILWGNAGKLNIQPIDAAYRSPRISMTETLIISGSLDISTPSSYATNELLPWLPNGRQIVLNEMSHEDLMKKQRPAYEFLVSHYFKTGHVENNYVYDDVDFRPARNLHRIAKFGYPIVLILSIFK